MTFSDSPPLYSKPKETASPYPVQQSKNKNLIREFLDDCLLPCLGYMPQPGGGSGSSYPPYPVSGSNFPPYPTNNYPGYPPAGGNFSSNSAYPYMPNPSSGYPPASGYNTNVSSTNGNSTAALSQTLIAGLCSLKSFRRLPMNSIEDRGMFQ